MDHQLSGLWKGAGLRGTYVHFPATARQVEEEGHLQLPEGFQVLTKPFSGELLQGILVALGGFLHFTFLVGAQDGKTHCWSAEPLRRSVPLPVLSPRLPLRVSPSHLHPSGARTRSHLIHWKLAWQARRGEGDSQDTSQRHKALANERPGAPASQPDSQKTDRTHSKGACSWPSLPGTQHFLVPIAPSLSLFLDLWLIWKTLFVPPCQSSRKGHALPHRGCELNQSVCCFPNTTDKIVSVSLSVFGRGMGHSGAREVELRICDST